MDEFAIRTVVRSSVTAVISNVVLLSGEHLASTAWAWVLFGLQVLGDVALAGYLWWGTAEPEPLAPSATRTLVRAAQRRRELRSGRG